MGKTQAERKTISKIRVSCLGPVDNPEKYVPPDWWRKIFNSIYLKTDGDVVDDIEITKMEVDLFQEVLQLKGDEKILDCAADMGDTHLNLQEEVSNLLRVLTGLTILFRKQKVRQKKKISP
jgi:hypothetical protein